MRLKFNFRDGLHFEKHDLTPMQLWGMGEDPGVEGIHAGVTVSQATALRLTAVYRCIRLISEAIAGMPIDIVRRGSGIREPVDRTPRWITDPNPESNIFEFKERILESILMDGNAFVLITSRDANGFPRELWTLDPRQIQVRRVRDLGNLTQPLGAAQGDMVYVWNGDQVLTRYGPSNLTGDVLHVRLASGGSLRGISPIDAARQAIGLGLVTEKFGAGFFGRGQTMSGVIQLPASGPGQATSKQNIDLIRENWMARHAGSDNAHRPGILTGGATWQGISITNEQAQFLDTRRFQVEEICRLYGIPPHMLGVTGAVSNWGTGVEQQTLGFLKFTLLPHIIRLETALSSLIPRGQEVKLNQRALVRADSLTEADVIVKLVLNGLMNRNEGRALYDQPPVPGGDQFMVPLNEQILVRGQAPVTPPTTSSPNGNGQPAEVPQP